MPKKLIFRALSRYFAGLVFVGVVLFILIFFEAGNKHFECALKEAVCL